jgi:hypothetical protein
MVIVLRCYTPLHKFKYIVENSRVEKDGEFYPQIVNKYKDLTTTFAPVNIIYRRYELWSKTKKIKNAEGFNSARVG